MPSSHWELLRHANKLECNELVLGFFLSVRVWVWELLPDITGKNVRVCHIKIDRLARTKVLGLNIPEYSKALTNPVDLKNRMDTCDCLLQ